MKKLKISNTDTALFPEIVKLINESRNYVAQTTNSTLVILYWKIGKRINEDILKNVRAKYGDEIILSLSFRLTQTYGNGWSEKHIRHCLRSAETFSEQQILYAVSRKLCWTHIRTIMYLKDDLQRDFYLQMTSNENWSTRQLQERIDSMLYERTAISKKPSTLIKKELTALRKDEKASPDLIFRDPYILDFLGLKNAFSEKNLEDAILREMEQFLLELGQGFTFIERQKRMIIDERTYKVDLLFFHRKLNRLIAIDLKLGKFKAEYKGQMELYLRWLEKYEMQPNEERPLGLLLCAEGNNEQIDLLQLDKSGIKVAQYLTELPSKKILKNHLHKAIKLSKSLIDNK